MQFTPKQHAYFIGIKGVGMAAVAVILKEMGLQVSGSDVDKPFITDAQLEAHDIDVFKGFNAERLTDLNPDVIIIGASWNRDNAEVKWARESGRPAMLYSEALGVLSAEKRTVAVAGTHGKTTTTSILANVFNYAKKKPSYVIGTGIVRGLEGCGHWDKGKHFIVEADDYKKAPELETPKFMDLDPSIVVLTSCEFDHPDFFKSLEQTEEAFENLIRNVREDGYTVAFYDDPSVRKIIKGKEEIETYGTHEDARFKIDELKVDENGTSWVIRRDEEFLGTFTIPVSGEQYAWNATAAVIVANAEGIPLEKIRAALAEFKGAQRRFDIYEAKGKIFVDDYAHHPTAVKLTLEAARKRWPEKKIWCFYQPHQVSRTEVLLDDFAQSFEAADKVLLVDIFASAREAKNGVTSKDLAEATKKHHGNVEYVGSLEAAKAYLEKHYKEADVIFTMGAGDIYEIAEEFFHV